MSEENKIESLQHEGRTFQPPKSLQAGAYVKSMAEYEALYKRADEDPEGFWGDRARELLTRD